MSNRMGRTSSEISGKNWNLKVGFVQLCKPPLRAGLLSLPLTTVLLSNFSSYCLFLFYLVPNFLSSSFSASLSSHITTIRFLLLSPRSWRQCLVMNVLGPCPHHAALPGRDHSLPLEGQHPPNPWAVRSGIFSVFQATFLEFSELGML